jgi:agmatinase
MHIDSYFSIANSLLEDADYTIFGIPYDATQSYKPGSRFAPFAIRESSWNLEAYSQYFSFNLDRAKVCDAGNVNCDGGFEEIAERISNLVHSLDSLPIAIGGEHTVSYAIAKEMDACYVVFDAHFDLRDEFDGSVYNHACTLRRIFDEGKDIILIGVRSGTEEEKIFAEEHGIEFFYSWEIIEKGVELIAERVLKQDKIYISLDMDVFDPSFAPGVSTPEPLGIHPIHFIRILDYIADRTVGFDVVEVVPDANKVTQMLAAKLIMEFIAARESK